MGPAEMMGLASVMLDFTVTTVQQQPQQRPQQQPQQQPQQPQLLEVCIGDIHKYFIHFLVYLLQCCQC